ncbi:PAS domain S-box protein [Hymenobacter sp. 15J16-1T3B]|uniref:PAS domain S-box protein n=1 Tax=Hymenobacter sp. 15J16-1T3B TaxID=2886941 RepID=UPI001D1180D2|nr:PAS domain S-box protein [Hymenobacter sp. 15J16-1T3B]MCC3157654.1 PAS domain S-box protein [Hymenobacter sp. 15J16-1T3B]
MEQTPDEFDAVRRRMEELRAQAETRRGLVTTDINSLTPADVRRLVQELQTHQIELEMQYEELLSTQVEREAYYQQYIDLFEFAPVGYCTLDALGVVQQLNLRATQLLGTARATAVGRRLVRYVPVGDERTHFYSFLQRVLTTDARQSCELEMQRADGSTFFALLEGVRLLQPAGDYCCRLAFSDDNARRQAVQDLAASEQKFRTLFHDSADAAVLLREFVFVDCNRAALAMLGATRGEQLIGQPALLLSPELQPDGTPSLQRLAQSAETAQRSGSHRFEWLCRRFSGEDIWQEVVLTPVRVDGEALLHAVWRDITEQKRRDQRLRESEQRFRTVFEQSADGMLLLQDGRYVDANAAALGIIGAARREQLVGQPADVCTPAVQPNGKRTAEWIADNVEIARREGSLRWEVLMTRFTGEEIWVEGVLTPIELPGQPLLTHVCWRDVTERRLGEQRVQESETRLSTALQAAELGVAQWNFVTDEVFFDERARRMFGLPVDGARLTFPDIRALLHPDDRARVEDALQQAVAEHRPVEMDQRVVLPDGAVRYIVSSGQVSYDAAGQALSMTGVVQDVTEKKQAARQLQESEARLKTAVLAADMGIGIWNFDTQLFYVDARGRRMFGLASEGNELTFDELMAVVLPADRERAAAALQQAATGDGLLDVEVRVVHPDGEVHHVCANGQVMHDEAGRPVRMSGVLRDVTHSRLAEQRLRESEEQLRTALSAANMGVGLWEPQQQKVTVDARTAEIFGCAAGPGRYPAAEFSALLHPDDLPGVVGQIQLSLQSRLAFSLHARVLRPGGAELRYVRISGQALYDAHGQPERVAGVVRDITEFRRANLRLRASEERLRLALQASHMGVFEWSFESDELFWDERTQTIFGRPYEDRRLSFDAIRDAVHPADAAAVTRALTTTIRDGVPFELEHRIVRPDGSVRHVAASGQVHYDEAGRPQRLTGLVRDVTERRHAQEELNSKNRLLDHILTTIPVVLSRVGADGTLQEVVGAGLRRLGVADNAIAGRNVFEAYPQLRPYIERLLTGEEVQFVGEPPNRGGEQAYFQNYGFFDEEKQSGVLFGIDVTETHQANTRLAADAAFLQGLVSNIQEGIMAFDAELRVTEWNYLMEQYLLVQREAVLGQVIFEALPFVNVPRNRDILRRALAGETQTYYNVAFSRRAGFFDAAFVPLRDAAGTVAGVLGVIRDVTERNRLMEEATGLRLQREKEVLSAIMHTQEDERKRIAEALHNGVGQLLYAAKLHLYNQPVEEGHRAAALGLLNEAIKSTRTISFELTPNILEDFGLKTALEELCKRIPKQNLDVHLSVGELPAALPILLETAVYRIVQELLNNVIKHAEAREAFIYVEPQGPQLHVSVEDDGVGFDVEMATQKRGGIGLAGIRNRVGLLAGQLTIRSMPGRGTTISIEIPLPKPGEDAGG